MAKQETINVTRIKEKEGSKYKDSPFRSILKAFSWRLMAMGATFLISFIIFRRYTEQSLDESIENAGLIASIEFLSKIALYYLHERLWTNIAWGKYWKRSYWRSRAWRRLYNKLHEKERKRIKLNSNINN